MRRNSTPVTSIDIKENSITKRDEWHFLLYICLLVALILIAFSTFVILYTHREQTEQTHITARAFLSQTRRNIELWMDGEIAIIASIAMDADVQSALENLHNPQAAQKAEQVLENHHITHSRYAFITLTPTLNFQVNSNTPQVYDNSQDTVEQGRVLKDSVKGKNIGRRLLDIEHIHRIFNKTSTYIHTPQENTLQNYPPIFIISHRVEKNGSTIGIVSAGIHLDYISNRFIHPDLLGPAVNILMVDEKGYILATDGPSKYLPENQEPLFKDFFPPANEDIIRSEFIPTLPNQELIPAKNPIRTNYYDAVFATPWYLMLSKKNNILFGGKHDYTKKDFLRLTLFSLLLMISATLAIGWVFIKKINHAQTALEKLNLELEQSNYTDALTGLPNRKAFIEEVEKCEKEHAVPLGIVSFDVDGLKVINDMVGHIAGDKLLMDAAHILKSVVLPPGFLYRTGGDEFTALYPNCIEEDVSNIRERLISELEQFNTHRTDFMEPSIHISCGYALRRESCTSISSLYQLADNRMYRYKRANNMHLREKLFQLAQKALLIIEPDAIIHQAAEKYLIETLVSVHPEFEVYRKSLMLLSMYHDIGKIARNTEEDMPNLDSRAENQKIAEQGFRIAMVFPQTLPIAHMILRQYEWWSEGNDLLLTGQEILPIECNLFAIIQSFEVESRDYSSPQTAYLKGVEALKKMAGKQLDPDLVELFISKVVPNL